MGLGGALGAALSGLRVTSANLELVAHNISNSATPGYSRKVAGQVEVGSQNNTSGVRLTEVSRVLDELVNTQLRQETSGMSYADTIARFYTQIDELFGQPGGPSALDTLTNNLSASLETLSTSPESVVARQSTLSDAQVLASTLNGLSADIQSLRMQTEDALNQAVGRVNEILGTLEDINTEITSTGQTQNPPATLLDQRDQLLDELASLVDIRVQERDRGAVGVYTRSGTMLLDGDPTQLRFDSQGTLNPQSQYSTDPAERSVGTISMISGQGYAIDLIADKAFRSGEIKALIDLRDSILPQAQAQLDTIADAMARALSAKDVTSTAAVSGAQAGLSIDLAELQDGDQFTLTYTDASSVLQTVTVVRVDEAGAPALGNDYTTDPNDTVLAIDFSGGIAAAAAALDTALGASLTVSSSGTSLTVLDDGAADTTDVTGLSAIVTESSLTGGSAALPFFKDAGDPTGDYTGRHGTVSQITGFAGRITVNATLLDNPSLLVNYDTGVASGDTTRPQALFERLMQNDVSFRGSADVAGTAGFKGSLPDFINRVMSFQGREAESAQRAYDTQEVAFQQLTERKAETSGVDIDQEMAFLIALQTAYQANARVISTYREMTDLLLRI